MAHAWHAEPTRAKDLAQPCVSNVERALLAMMGSGVRVPASASLMVSNVEISSHPDLYRTQAVTASKHREIPPRIARWHTRGTRYLPRRLFRDPSGAKRRRMLDAHARLGSGELTASEAVRLLEVAARVERESRPSRWSSPDEAAARQFAGSRIAVALRHVPPDAAEVFLADLGAAVAATMSVS
jgi:hypothetical protein